jgi:site-specific recombinase XerD
LSARVKGSGWMADFTRDGQRYREFGFQSELEAVAWEAQARVALAKGQHLPLGPSPTKTKRLSIRDHVRYCGRTHWMDHKSGSKSTRNAELFAEFIGPDVPVGEALTTVAINDYVEELKADETSGSTINRRLAAVSVLIYHAKALDLIDRDPLLPWQKEGKNRLRYFTEDEAKAIIATTEFWGYANEARLFRFLLDTGCRVGEALKLSPNRDIHRISPERLTVTFGDTKNGDDRTIPLTARAYESARLGGFTGLNRWGLRSLWERLRTHHEFIGTASLHTFRHTCASWLVQRGVELYRVQKWLGHKSMVTTQRYAHLSPRHLEGMVDVLED